MSQPVKLSDELVLDARLIAELTERSIAGQIEFWARLGRAIEPLLTGDKSLALRKSGDQKPLSKLLSTVDSPEGRKRVSEYLSTQPFPRYETITDQPGMLVRIEQSGARTIGRFVNRQFQASKASASRKPASKVSVSKKSATKKSPTKKSPAKKSPTKKSPAKKSPSKRSR